MSELDRDPGPALAAPSPVLAVPPALAASGALLLLVLIGAVYWLVGTDRTDAAVHVPQSLEQLGPAMVTLVDASNPAAISAAVAAMHLPQAQRIEIEKAALAGKQRLGWIVLVDSVVDDGDTVAVDADGLVQQVVLTKRWTPVAVPLGYSGAIGITGVRDGGGGITVALATRSGVKNLRWLLPGERIVVVEP
jgi:hypothetical protein